MVALATKIGPCTDRPLLCAPPCPKHPQASVAPLEAAAAKLVDAGRSLVERQHRTSILAADVKQLRSLCERLAKALPGERGTTR